MGRLAAAQVRWIKYNVPATPTGGPFIVAELTREGVRIETIGLG